MQTSAILLCLCPFLLAACGQPMAAPPEAPEAPLDGRALFEGKGSCAQCHGDQGQGTMMGISLEGRAAAWTADELASYIQDPKAYAKTHAAVQQRMMPAAPDLSEAERLALARHALTLMGPP